jgi:hypothetical protein
VETLAEPESILMPAEDNIKRTMQVAAVIGRDFADRIFYSITGMRWNLR